MNEIGLALALAGLIPPIIYIVILEVSCQRALEVPEEVWQKNRRWTLDHARLYASVLEGLVLLVVVMLIWLRHDRDVCRFLVGISMAVIIGSMVTDIRRKSKGGLAVEIPTLVLHILALIYL